ncbi:MAG: aminodeoxychorismate/anthranilate synthase component II [Patescibacteria group bacterium]|jgi:anthranilate synthase/aminodeoxychorismate synthase-like glutamine amidotransferase
MKTIGLIDNHDSFTYNLVAYLRQCRAKVIVKNNTTPVSVIKKLKPDLLVYSPGPGNPAQAGKLLTYIKKFSGVIPQFGVCLGMQAMLEAFGGSLQVLPKPVHGRGSVITHDGSGIFQGLPKTLLVGRYHSLAADYVPDCFVVTAKTKDNIVMGISHKSLSITGVQFHPESILTNPHYGLKMIRNVLEQKN